MPKDTARRTHRSPGEGHVYEVRPGRYRAEAQFTRADGTTARIRVYGRTTREARDKLTDKRRELRLGATTPAATITLAAYLTDWLEARRATVRPSTWRTHEMYVRVYLIPALGRRRLVELTARDVAAALATFARVGRPGGNDRRPPRPVSAVTVNHVRSTLRAALTDAQEAGLVIRNVAAAADPHHVDHRPITYLTTRDLNRLLEATAEQEFGPLYALAATTGLRRGELLGLRWSDITEAGVLTVRQAMGRTRDGWGAGDVKSARSRRTIPLPTRARQALETQRTRQRFAERAAGAAWHNPTGLVFTDSLGGAILPEYVSHRFARDVRAAGVPRVRLHDLRHSAATTLLAAGVPLAVISDWLGHSNVSITAAAYAAVVPELMTDAADAMDRALDGAS